MLVALESLQHRLAFPKLYYIFYEFFYKAALGEKTWTKCIQDEDKGRIGNDNTKAFALLILSNNYKAWLSNKKEQYGNNLITEYETVLSATNPSIVDILLPRIKIPCIFDNISGENNKEVTSPQEQKLILLKDTTSKEYKHLQQKRTDEVMSNITNNQELVDDIQRGWRKARIVEEMTREDERQDYFKNTAEHGKEPTDYGKEQARKKTKLMKGMRRWTNRGERGKDEKLSKDGQLLGIEHLRST